MSIDLQLINYIAAFCCLLLAARTLNSEAAVRTPSLLLALSFLVLAAHSLLGNYVASWGRANLAGILIPTLALLIGPLIYFAFDSASKSKNRFELFYLPHLLPAVLVANMLALERVVIDIDVSIVISLFIYSLLLIRLLRLGELQFASFTPRYKQAYRWLLAMTVLLSIGAISEAVIVFELKQGYSLAESRSLLIVTIFKFAALTTVLYTALLYPSLFGWLSSAGQEQETASKDPAQLQQMELLSAEFKAFTEEKKLFTQEGVSLKSVAQQLSVPVRVLSESINHSFRLSFSKYMNVQRVEAAKQLLDESDLTVTQVMYEAGFRTKSNFNKEFQAVTGLSPSNYRKRTELQQTVEN